MVALGRVVLSSREHVMAIEPRGKGLVGVLLRYPYEVRGEDEYFADIPDVDTPKDMVDIAAHIVMSKAGHFDPDDFEDRYETALAALIDKKRKGETVTPAKAAKLAPVHDLMAALRASVAKERPSERAPARRAASSRRPAKARRVRPRAGGREAPPPHRDGSTAPLCHAARTVVRNWSTSTLRWLLSLASDCADDSTCEDAEPVSAAPLVDVGDVGGDLGGALGGLLDVAGDLGRRRALLLDRGGDGGGDLGDAADGAADLLDGGDRVVGRRLHAGDLGADLAGRLGGLGGERLDLLATTAKPLPASPARAASMVALRASRLVCSAIAVISLTTSPMRSAACDSSLMRASVLLRLRAPPRWRCCSIPAPDG